MDNKGSIFTYSIIYTASEDFKEKVPFVIAIIEDSEGTRTLSMIENYKDAQKIEIGQKVEFSRVDEKGNKVYKF